MVLGGHTPVSRAVKNIVVTVTAIGEAYEQALTCLLYISVLFGLMHFSNMGAGVKFSSCLIQVISAGLMGVLFCMLYALSLIHI